MRPLPLVAWDAWLNGLQRMGRPWRHRLSAALAGTAGLFILLDALTTQRLLALDAGEEANPLPAWALSHLGEAPTLWVPTTVLLLLLCPLLAARPVGDLQAIVVGGAVVAVTFKAVVVASNLHLLLHGSAPVCLA